MKNIHEIAIIENYLQGKLTEEKRREFESRLAKDPDLAKDTENMRLLIAGILAAGQEQMKDELQKIHQEVIEQKVKRIPIRRYALATAAVIALFIVSALFLKVFNTQLPPEKAYDKFYHLYSSDNMTRSSESNTMDADISDAFETYNAGNYQTALAGFEKIINTDESNMEVHFYAGLSLMELENFDKAEMHFNYIIENQGIIYLKSATWYKALCLLKLDKVPDSKQVLTIISDDTSSPYAKDAQKLLKSL